MVSIDVCGLNCPEPVLMVKKAMTAGEKEIEVVSDAQVAVENITRLCDKMGYGIRVSQKDGGLFSLSISKS